MNAFTLSPIKVDISDLRLRTLIGFNDEELEKKQDVIINASIQYNAENAIKHDKAEDCVNYKSITKKIIQHVENAQFMLLEKLCADIIDIIMLDPQVLHSSVTVDKPHALRFADSVSTTLEANR